MFPQNSVPPLTFKTLDDVPVIVGADKKPPERV